MLFVYYCYTEFTLALAVVFSIYVLLCYAEPRKPKVKSTKISEQEIISTILKSYDWRVRPRGTNLSNTGIVFSLLFFFVFIS